MSAAAEGLKMTVADLRKRLDGLPDDMLVCLEIDQADEHSDLAQADLRDARVESRCDEVECLYLWGSYDEDMEEYEEQRQRELHAG